MALSGAWLRCWGWEQERGQERGPQLNPEQFCALPQSSWEQALGQVGPTATLGSKPWGPLLASPSRDDVGGDRRPARPGERGWRPVCTWPAGESSSVICTPAPRQSVHRPSGPSMQLDCMSTALSGIALLAFLPQPHGTAGAGAARDAYGIEFKCVPRAEISKGRARGTSSYSQ